MAKLTCNMPEDFIKKLSRLGKKTDEISAKVLEAGGEVAEEEIRAKLKESIGKDTKEKSRSTGQLEAALGVTKVRADKNGNYDVKVGFAENRKDGKKNAMIANVLEYGRAGQPARPFLKPAKTKCKKKCMDAMVKKLEEEIKKV